MIKLLNVHSTLAAANLSIFLAQTMRPEAVKQRVCHRLRWLVSRFDPLPEPQTYAAPSCREELYWMQGTALRGLSSH